MIKRPVWFKMTSPGLYRLSDLSEHANFKALSLAMVLLVDGIILLKLKLLNLELIELLKI